MGSGRPEEKDFSQRLRLLVVAVSALQQTALADLLREALGEHAEVVVHDSVAAMRRAVQEQAVDCVLLALSDTGAGADEAVEAVLSAAPEHPVVVVARGEESSLALQAIQDGAQDFLLDTSADAATLERSIRYAVARKRTESRLARQALHDPLTGLPNRALMLDRVTVALARSRRRPTSLALLFLDLDGFKRVNDGLGHEAGDELLVEVARRLQSVLRPGDTVARYGGDEFVILCEDLRGQREALRVAERARVAIAEPCTLRGQEVSVQASVGIARARREQTSVQELLREADAAMYLAKRRGGGVELFETEGGAATQREIEQRLREAIARAGLIVHYQPVVALGDGGLHSLEALVRWEQAGRGVQGPASFLSLAEDSGLIDEIDRWVLGEACRQLAGWRRDGLVEPGVPVSVNLSARSLRAPDLLDAIEHALSDGGLDRGSLAIELTEPGLEPDPVRGVVEALERLGVPIWLDDFGSDRSTLAALLSPSLAAVKLRVRAGAGGGADGDGDAGRNASTGTDDERRRLAAALGAAHAAGLHTIVTRIETDAQLETVRSLGADAGQGYRFVAPGSAEALARWLTAERTE